MSGPRIAGAGLAVFLAAAIACSRQSTAPTSPSGLAAAGADAAADGSTLKVSAPTGLAPASDFQTTDTPTLTSNPSVFANGGTGALQYRFQVFNDAGAQVQDSGLQGGPAFKITATLDFKKRHTWRVRAEFQGRVGPWSATASFISAEGGYVRGNEILDPIFNGVTFGERFGQTTFLPGVGIRLENNLSYVRYTLPVTLQAGEFSVEVLGLRPNAPGDKSKVMGMSTNSPDFITDPYRFDVQYRGTSGSPPNAITFRALYGSADDLSLRYEPDTAARLSSVFALNPAIPYLWKLTWGAGEVRVQVLEGGVGGRVLYNRGVTATKGTYNPQPHYLYLGAPSGRSGVEAASIPGTIFRNVWISPRPRP